MALQNLYFLFNRGTFDLNDKQITKCLLKKVNSKKFIKYRKHAWLKDFYKKKFSRKTKRLYPRITNLMQIKRVK